jgi:AAA domain-containing protein
MAAKLNLDINANDFLAIEQIENLEKDIPRITREIEAFGDVELVIVDTSPSLFQGDNENDNMQMRDHAKRLRRLCDLPGRPVVLALCHPTKHVSGPDSLLPRGGGAALAEADGNLSLWGHDDKLADLHWCGKFRGPDFAKITFRLSTINTTTLVDKKGRLLPTVMAEVITDAEAEATETRAVGQEDKLLVAMSNNPMGSLTEWARACRWYMHGNPEQPDKKRAENVMRRLKRTKLVSMKGRDHVLTKDGNRAAKKAANPTATSM